MEPNQKRGQAQADYQTNIDAKLEIEALTKKKIEDETN
jgi:hypothetical protein